MTIETLRGICMRFPDVTEDVKWGQDLCFLIGGKMFAVVDLEPPHALGFKCTPEAFGELVERAGIIPAPYLARAMWVREEALGEALDRPELEALLRTAYEVVRAKLPKRALASAGAVKSRSKARAAKRRPTSSGGRRSRSARAASRRRRR
jgi:predicted DNA-binding protein (MmcQ/YjbR family)